MALQNLKDKYDAAVKQQSSNPAEAIRLLRDIVLGSHPNDVDSVKVKESAVTSLGQLYASQGNAEAVRTLLSELRPLLKAFPKAKTAKLVRLLIESLSEVPDTTQLQLEVCKEQVAWAVEEKRTFLRHRIEARLVALHLAAKDYPSALALISKLLTEVKRLDDKLLLVEVHLLESRTHHALRNVPKAKAALTAGRAAANAIYIPPLMQSQIDTQSGVLHADEGDYKTAYSYFYEAFEGLNSLESPNAGSRLKYMLLCKIMTGKSEAQEVAGTIATKAGLKYSGDEVDCMAAAAKAYADRSLEAFQAALSKYSTQLTEDPFVQRHLKDLYGTLIEENLSRLIEPFSRVEISHVAELIELPLQDVEAKLSQMILDGKLAGTLDAGAGCLEVFTNTATEGVYPAVLAALTNIGEAIDSLAIRSLKVAA